jgi:hypothetical protein
MKSEVLVEEGGMTLVRHAVPAGFDSSPHYRALPADMCPGEHRCDLAHGELRCRLVDGEELEVRAEDAFHVRTGHLVDVLADAELDAAS